MSWPACEGAEPSRAGWQALERELCDDIRWWRLDQLAASAEAIYPERLLELLPGILAGVYPAEPLDITPPA